MMTPAVQEQSIEISRLNQWDRMICLPAGHVTLLIITTTVAVVARNGKHVPNIVDAMLSFWVPKENGQL